jgi:hypothetical protein
VIDVLPLPHPQIKAINKKKVNSIAVLLNMEFSFAD